MRCLSSYENMIVITQELARHESTPRPYAPPVSAQDASLLRAARDICDLQFCVKQNDLPAGSRDQRVVIRRGSATSTSIGRSRFAEPEAASRRRDFLGASGAGRDASVFASSRIYASSTMLAPHCSSLALGLPRFGRVPSGLRSC